MLSWQLLRRMLSSLIACSLVDKYQCFIGNCCLHLLDKKVIHAGKDIQRRKGQMLGL
jgi:hypothetical protein